MPRRRKLFPVGSRASWDQGGSGQLYWVKVIEHLGRRSLRIRIESVRVPLPIEKGVSLVAPGDTMIILARNLLRPKPGERMGELAGRLRKGD